MFLSAILIVKNEEENLPRCLSSLDGVCDEIVVVDTGSSDRTVELARTAGARVEFFPWNGNESDARNASVRHARGEWIFQIDADEELSLELQEELRDGRELFGEEPFHSASVIWENHFEGGETNRTRILRLARRDGFCFEGGIHPSANYRAEAYPLRGALRHYGYQWTPERRQRKAKHILDHLKPYLQEPRPTFDRWCQYLTALNLIGEEARFLQVWGQVARYSREERLQSAATPSWLENSANFFRMFSNRDDFASGADYAEEILSVFPQHNASRFYRLQGRVKARQWAEIFAESKRMIDQLAHDPGDNNPTWGSVQEPAARAWQWLAENQSAVNSLEVEHPGWLIDPLTLPVFLFGNRAPAISRDSSAEGSELLQSLIEAETLDRCHAGASSLRQLGRCLQRWPHLNWLRMGLDKLERGESFRLETLAHRTVHLV